ncbi:MAG: hypothetical protein K2Q18_19415 [Bdellovibrionales bacterium]|nr:hypothetical protein [Bdellovibrionales bacterium]
MVISLISLSLNLLIQSAHAVPNKNECPKTIINWGQCQTKVEEGRADEKKVLVQKIDTKGSCYGWAGSVVVICEKNKWKINKSSEKCEKVCACCY